jgi:diacylglycerol kinase (ATP)
MAGSRGGSRSWKRLREACRRLGYIEEKDYSLEWTCQGQTAEQARRAARIWDRVLAVGGDGTVRQVVEGLIKSGTGATVGVIPQGTGNDFSRTIGVYPFWRKGCLTGIEPVIKWLMTAPATPLDVLAANDDLLFVSYCSIGFDAEIARAYERVRRHPMMRAVLRGRVMNEGIYAVLGLKHCRRRLPELRIALDTVHTSWKDVGIRAGTCTLIVSNGSSYAGGARIVEGSCYNDGQFDVTIIPHLRPFILLIISRLWPRLRQACTLPNWGVQGACLPLPRGCAVQVDGDDCTTRLARYSTLSIRVAGQIPVVLGPPASEIDF